MSKIVMTEQSSAPDTPGSGKVAIYVDTDGSLCWRKDDGVIVKIASAGSYTLTIPATGTAALLGTAQTFSAAQTFSNVLTAPGMKPASNSTTALQLQNAGGTAIVTVDSVNNLIDLDKYQLVPVTATPAATASTYDLTVGFPDVQTKLLVEFRGWIQDDDTAASISAIRFAFRVIKGFAGATPLAATGFLESIAPVSGITVSSISINSITTTSVVVRVTMSGTSTGNIIASGVLAVSGGINRITSAAFA